MAASTRTPRFGWRSLKRRLGRGDAAHELLSFVNPINRSVNQDHAKKYRVEPYAVAADIYSAPGHVGRGGWTWYTGAAGWMYRVTIEHVLGIRREGGVAAHQSVRAGRMAALPGDASHSRCGISRRGRESDKTGTACAQSRLTAPHRRPARPARAEQRPSRRARDARLTASSARAMSVGQSRGSRWPALRQAGLQQEPIAPSGFG